ncbi:MAG: hypothetical protein ACPG3W_04185 [Synechococcus sp.]|uniref:hypothetical protein n=1 Tax=Synechococcus sp. BMK-MC-1 TaxID=1442551 RepID=UPI0016446164|nr:hypothetical protein [Synechococcus sp. BMK-MC-1]QNI66927.1 hypothetical protein SynBMKMC1_00841 [Synechococcus sp. BMK-MC-1]
MSSKRFRRVQPPDSFPLQADQRRELVMIVTKDDMKQRLKELAKEGKRDDCLALMRELGDWQGSSSPTEVLFAPHLRRTER